MKTKSLSIIYLMLVVMFVCPVLIVKLFKSTTTKQINELRRLPGIPVWQRNYYEHIIRNDTKSNHIRQYIVENPLKWESDSENPENIIVGLNK